MAKIITQRALGRRSKEIDVMACGIMKGSTPKPAKAAQIVLREIYDENVLSKDKTKLLDKNLISEAALILGVTQTHVDKIKQIFPLSQGKVYLLSEYFGLQGDVMNPYREPNETDLESLKRYRECRDRLRAIIEPNIDEFHRRVLC